MLKALIVSALMTSSFAFAEDQLAITCSPVAKDANGREMPIAGGKSYNILVPEAEGGTLKLQTTQAVQNGTKVLDLKVVTPQTVWGYGDTYIISINRGRSGYALFYANVKSKTGLVDISLFGQQFADFNTNGPVTNLSCKKVEGR